MRLTGKVMQVAVAPSAWVQIDVDGRTIQLPCAIADAREMGALLYRTVTIEVGPYAAAELGEAADTSRKAQP